MKTDDLIARLSADLKPSDSGRFYLRSFLLWVGGTAAILFGCFYLMPVRPDFSTQFQSPAFRVETLLSLVVLLTSAFVTYRTVVPGLSTQTDRRIGGILFGVLGVLLLSSVSFDLRNEFSGEMNLHRGRCGPIMLLIGTADALLLLYLARRGASTRPVVTGVWIALSAGALALFVMQFICEHENFTHVAFWHLVPVAVLVAAGVLAGRRFLKW